MTQVGTPRYVAPEVVMGKQYNEKVDVYSFGIMLNEMDTKYVPYTSKRNRIKGYHVSLIQRVHKPHRTWQRWKEANDIDKNVIQLAVRCWSTLPEKRPSMNGVLLKLKKIKSYLQGEHFNERESVTNFLCDACP